MKKITKFVLSAHALDSEVTERGGADSSTIFPTISDDIWTMVFADEEEARDEFNGVKATIARGYCTVKLSSGRYLGLVDVRLDRETEIWYDDDDEDERPDDYDLESLDSKVLGCYNGDLDMPNLDDVDTKCQSVDEFFEDCRSAIDRIDADKRRYGVDRFDEEDEVWHQYTEGDMIYGRL